MSRQINPISSLNVVKHTIPAYRLIPNSTAQNKPLLIYRSVFPSEWSTSDMEDHLRTTDVVVPQWRYTMYSQSHFHTTSHEVLAIARGRAKLCFGHEDNPDCVIETVTQGDAIIVPAGLAHRLMEDINGNFLMIGSYPKDKQWDMCYGNQNEVDQIKTIAALPWFDEDPIYGSEGPVHDVVER